MEKVAARLAYRGRKIWRSPSRMAALTAIERATLCSTVAELSRIGEVLRPQPGLSAPANLARAPARVSSLGGLLLQLAQRPGEVESLGQPLASLLTPAPSTPPRTMGAEREAPTPPPIVRPPRRGVHLARGCEDEGVCAPAGDGHSGDTGSEDEMPPPASHTLEADLPRSTSSSTCHGQHRAVLAPAAELVEDPLPVVRELRSAATSGVLPPGRWSCHDCASGLILFRKWRWPVVPLCGDCGSSRGRDVGGECSACGLRLCPQCSQRRYGRPPET